jgi:hypothetical protein
MSAREAAIALAAWCGDGKEVNGAHLPLFYKQHVSYRKHVSDAKAHGHPKGVRSFIALHGQDLMTWRLDGTVLFIRALEGKSESQKDSQSDEVPILLAKLKSLIVNDADDAAPLQVVNNLLKPLKDACTMRQFASQMKGLGLCLANGEMYGSELPRKLKDKSLRVNKADAKKFPLVKKCLVLCR